MKNTLIDAGPIIALFDKSDKYHEAIVSFLSTWMGRLITTWPVITEASHFLDFNVDVQADLLRWIDRGGLYIHDLGRSSIGRLIELTSRYRNVPMDLADATLVIVSEELGIKEIISIDSDFDVYRTLKKEFIQNNFKPEPL